MDLDSVPAVAGISLSGNQPYVIADQDNRALCESIGVLPAGDGSAHPIFFYIATQVGMSKTVAELCSTCEFDVEDGPMMIASRATFFSPLMLNQPYMVSGEILSLKRKHSRKLGLIDVLEYELRLSLVDGTPVLSNTNTWVLPRKEFS